MMTTGGAGLRRGTALVRRAPFLVNAALSACCCFHSSFQVPDTPLGRSRSKNGDTEMLKSRLQGARVTKIAFLRHGETAPAKNGVDFDRLLTDEGRQQAKDSGRIMAHHLLPFYPRCLVSPAPRTMETAQLFFQAATIATGDSSSIIKLEPVPTLYGGTMQPEGSRLFRQLGYSQLSAYLHHSDINDRNAARTVLGEYAYSVAQVLSKELASSQSNETRDEGGNNDEQGTTLCIVGHSIYLPAAALGVASLVGCCDPASEDVMLSINTGEAEGYLINLQSRQVTYLSRN